MHFLSITTYCYNFIIYLCCGHIVVFLDTSRRGSLIISSPKPRAHVSFDHCWSLSTSFSYFHLLQNQPNFDIKHYKCLNFYKCSNEEPRPISKGDNGEVVKIYRQLLKILFSTATELISIEFVYKASVGDGFSRFKLHPSKGR